MTSLKHGGQEVFLTVQSTIRRGSALSGAAAYLVTNGQRSNNPRIISEYYDFHREMLNDKAKRLTEVSCRPLWLPRMI
jgi:hypothetical protein